MLATRARAQANRQDEQENPERVPAPGNDQ